MARSPMLATKVYHYVRDMIEINQFKAGERLLEEEVSRKTGVSRSPVRVAFADLAEDGYLSYTENRGMIVRDLKAYGKEDADVCETFLLLFAGFVADTYIEEELADIRKDFAGCWRWQLTEWRNALLADLNHYRSRVILEVLADLEDRRLLGRRVLNFLENRG